jgi:predicted RNA-binding Zn-ribbon protein involved in translation (DUF1610 family)
LKAGQSLPVAGAIAGIVFTLWYFGITFLSPLFNILFPAPFLSMLVTGLVLTAVYTPLQYFLSRDRVWYMLLLGAGAGWTAAYLLLRLVGIWWPIEAWLVGLAVFLAPPASLSVLLLLRSRAKTTIQAAPAPAEQAVEVVVEPKPAEETPATTPPPPQQPLPAAEQGVKQVVEQPSVMQSYALQLAEPAAPPEKIDSEEFEEYLLEYLDLSKQTEIIPVPASNPDGALFPAIQEKIDIETSRLMVFFKKLQEKGILKIGGIEFKKAVCPRCYSAQSIVSLRCKKCRSANISRQRILQHESCGFLGPEERFYESGRFICPRCGTEVTVASEPEETTAHERLKVHSSLFICYQCDEVNPEPYVSFKCLTCGLDYDYNVLELKTFYRYIVNQDILQKAVEHNKPIKLMSETIRSLGYEVERGVSITGSSSVAYRADLLVKQNGQPKTAVFFIRTDKKDEQLGSVTKIMSMKLDLANMDVLVLSYPELHLEAKKILDLFNIYYVDALYSKDMRTVAALMFRRGGV